MSHYIKRGNQITVTAEGAIDVRETLPPANYIVQVDQFGEYFLEEIAPFTLPTKYYGDIDQKAARIINTYHDRSVSTGVLLGGEKGSGKTLLAKKISNMLLAEQIATVVINECFHGDKFNQFIQAIDQPCVVFFDEFEKVYDRDNQEHLLTLLDGTFSTKKLFILTTNSAARIDQHMQNRPGRIFYSIKYAGLDVEFIRMYCNDNLNNKAYIDEICKLSTLFAAFNFDIMKALVEEMNRYNESPKEALKMLNATPEEYENKFTASITVNGVELDSSEVYDDGEWAGNPLSPMGIEVEYINPKREEDNEPYWKTVRMSPSNLMAVDPTIGSFTFMDDKGNVIVLKRKNRLVYQYDAF